jgi:predicted transcriptional regulator
MSVEELEKAVAALSPEKLSQFSEWFETFYARKFHSASPEELQGIDRGLRDSAEGKFASAAEVEATFAKYRR